MTTRQKKGLTYIITGVVTACIGFVLIKFDVTPTWVDTLLGVIVGGCGGAGITLAFTPTTSA
jgi:hypothetical protein